MSKLPVRVLLPIIAGVTPAPATADSWMPAAPQTYVAADHSARITILPRETDSLDYYESKVEERTPARSPPGSTATMEVNDASGRWVRRWTGSLVNEVAPVEVLVTPQGKRLVTFDDWYSLGYGHNAVVVYDEEGKVLSRHALEAIFPAWFVAALPHSASSIQWRNKPRLSADGETALIPVRLPNADDGQSGEEPQLDLQLRLADGAVTGLAEEPWLAALTRSAAVAREICASELAFAADYNEPIAAPSIWDERTWHFYLNELFFRTVPNALDDEGPVQEATVLRPENADDVRTSVTFLRETLRRKSKYPGDDVRMIGSPDSNWLLRQILGIAPSIRNGSLSGVQLIVVIEEVDAEQVRKALAGSGADLRIVDPRQTFPQRPERLKRIDFKSLPVCQAPAA